MRLALTALLVVIGCGLTAETSTWKQGLKGYRGTRDTYLTKLNSDRSMNGKAVLSLTSNEAANPRQDRILICFDNLGLPQKARIVSAKIRLYAFSMIPGKPTPVDPVLCAAALLSPWNEKEASWNESEKGKAWNTPGGDFSTENTRTVVPIEGFKPGWIEFDVGNSLAKMLAEGKCHGWIIYSSATKNNNNATISFRDWEFPGDSDPELVVEWDIALPE